MTIVACAGVVGEDDDYDDRVRDEGIEMRDPKFYMYV